MEDGAVRTREAMMEEGASSVLRCMVGQSSRRQLVNHQSPAKMKTHGGVSEGRSHGENLGGGSRGVSKCVTMLAQMVTQTEQSQNLGDPEDLEGQDKQQIPATEMEAAIWKTMVELE